MAGAITPFLFEVPPLQLAHFDLGGVLYHANYYLLYEQAREAFLRRNGISYPELAQRGQHLAVVESRQQFHRPVRYGDTLSLELTAQGLKRSSVTLTYRIFAADRLREDSLYHCGSTRLAFAEKTADGFRPSRFSEKLQAAFASIECGAANE